MQSISVVIPLYKCSLFIPELTGKLHLILRKITSNYEIIYINDGSPENDWDLVCDEALKDIRVKGICFTRNFGQHFAISAGLNQSKGEWAVIMDGDLQDDPEAIELIYKCAVEKSYEVVFVRRIQEDIGFFRKLGSKIFYKVLNLISNRTFKDNIGNYSIISRKVTDQIKRLPEISNGYGLLINRLGFKTGYVPYIRKGRQNKPSSYNNKKLTSLALSSLAKNSTKPFIIILKTGFAISLLLFFIGIIYIIRYFAHTVIIPENINLFSPFWIILTIVFLLLGLMGIYFGKIFNKARGWPTYIISSTINIETVIK
jgi:dolichol-phosphate mannosyltransferase